MFGDTFIYTNLSKHGSTVQVQIQVTVAWTAKKHCLRNH